VSEPLRILYFSSLFPSPTHPYSGPFSLRRVQALIGLGSSVRVVCPVGLTPPMRLGLQPIEAVRWVRDQWSVPLDTSVEDVQVLYPKWIWPPKALIGGLDGHLLFRQLATRLDRIIERFQPDAIISSWLPDAAAACLAGRRSQVPVVAVAEGSDLVVLPGMYPWWPLMRRALNSAHAVAFVSESLKSYAHEVGIRRPREFVVHNGIDPDLFVPSTQPRTGHHAVVLTVGWNTRIKDQATLLRAAAILGPRLDRPLRLVIVGDGPLKPGLIRLAEELGIRESVEFLGMRPQADLVPIYQSADVFCLTSLFEGMGCVVLEAMACGTPVVATRVGGLPELVSSDTGILVPPSEPEALAQGLELALRRSWDRDALRAHVLANFTWERSAAKLVDIVQLVAHREASA
jgi:teichuronic acid biosynthesis glycosyltransferase TuaC